MKLRIEIDLNDNVFYNDAGYAVNDIMREIANNNIIYYVTDSAARVKLRDINEDEIGFAEIIDN